MRGGGVPVICLSWSDFDRAADSLSRRLIGGKFDAIYGVPRGGLPLAVALSNILDLPLITGEETSVRLQGKVLLVDDIADHGVTIARLRKRFGPLPAAVWVRRDRAKALENVEAVVLVNDDEWILFPWERPEHADKDETRFRNARGGPAADQ